MKKAKENILETIINKMFEIAGYNICYNDILHRQDDWYAQWTMTVEQSDEWRAWGVNYLMKLFKINKKFAETEMAWMNLTWGLKYSDYKI